MKPFWSFKASATDETLGELTLYGEIASSSWYGDEVTPKQFKKDLDALGAIKNLKIYINSPGGDAFAGSAIYSMLKRHPAAKTVYIDGLAASAASLIAMAGDKVVMPANAMMMIHRAWTIVLGNANELRKVAEMCDKVDASILTTYVAKTGRSDEDIMALLDAETWMTAQEAVDGGFADEIEAERKIAASLTGRVLNINGQTFDLERYKTLPPIDEHAPTDPEHDPVPPMNDSGGESRPVADAQTKEFNDIRRKILQTYEGGH
jgi:ATP-dependent Clp protease protease subunit